MCLAKQNVVIFLSISHIIVQIDYFRFSNRLLQIQKSMTQLVFAATKAKNSLDIDNTTPVYIDKGNGPPRYG